MARSLPIDQPQSSESGMTAAEIRELVRSEINAGRRLSSSARLNLWTAIGTTVTTVLTTVALIIAFVQSQIGNVQSQIVNVQSQIVNVQSQMTGLEDGIQSQLADINTRIDGVRSAAREDIRNVGVEIRALREEILPLAVRLASIESRLAVLSPAASGGAGSTLTSRELLDNAEQDGQLRAWPSPEELPLPADLLALDRIAP